jgi:hypothetical protein
MPELQNSGSKRIFPSSHPRVQLCRYVLGAECDGTTYHSSKSARDQLVASGRSRGLELEDLPRLIDGLGDGVLAFAGIGDGSPERG